jgi:hypothetical protein
MEGYQNAISTIIDQKLQGLGNVMRDVDKDIYNQVNSFRNLVSAVAAWVPFWRPLLAILNQVQMSSNADTNGSVELNNNVEDAKRKQEGILKVRWDLNSAIENGLTISEVGYTGK